MGRISKLLPEEKEFRPTLTLLAASGGVTFFVNRSRPGVRLCDISFSISLLIFRRRFKGDFGSPHPLFCSSAKNVRLSLKICVPQSGKEQE